MGLVSWFVGKVTEGLGKVVEKVGEITGIDALETAGIGMQVWGEDLADGVGGTSSYDNERKNIQQTESLSVMLADYSRNVEKDADQIQWAIEQNIQKFYDSLQTMINEYELNVSLNMLHREQRNALDSISGYLKNHVAKRVSLDDRECVDILKMEKGSAKTNSMKRFTDKVLREGKEKLCAKLKEFIVDGLADFDEEFNNLLNIKRVQLEQAEQRLAVFQDDRPGREYELAKSISVLDGILLLEHILGEEIA